MNDKLLQLPKEFKLDEIHSAGFTLRYSVSLGKWRAGYGEKARLFCSHADTPEEAVDLLIEKMRESAQ